MRNKNNFVKIGIKFSCSTSNHLAVYKGQTNKLFPIIDIDTVYKLSILFINIFQPDFQRKYPKIKYFINIILGKLFI